MSSEAAETSVVQSPLADLHALRAAPLVSYHGAEIPAHFDNTEREYRAVRSSAGLFDFSFRSKFILSGEHRARFLHRIISNDVKSLNPGQGVYATLLSAQGRILADLYVYADADQLWIDTDADLAAKAMAILQRYIIGDRVLIEPSALGAVSLQGPESRAALTTLFGASPGEFASQAELGHVRAEFAGHPSRIVKRSSTGEEGYEIWLEPAALRQLWKQSVEGGIVPCGVEALEILRVEAGIARYGPDLGEDTLPLEAGLLNALSFNKGCYIGQEIVERARSRGHVNWKLVGLRFPPDDSAPAPGDKLRRSDGGEIGEITSACWSPTLARAIALAYVRREASEPGTLLSFGGATAEVVALPFLRSGSLSSAEAAP